MKIELKVLCTNSTLSTHSKLKPLKVRLGPANDEGLTNHRLALQSEGDDRGQINLPCDPLSPSLPFNLFLLSATLATPLSLSTPCRFRVSLRVPLTTGSTIPLPTKSRTIRSPSPLFHLTMISLPSVLLLGARSATILQDFTNAVPPTKPLSTCSVKHSVQWTVPILVPLAVLPCGLAKYLSQYFPYAV